MTQPLTVGWQTAVSNIKLAALRHAVGKCALDLGCGRGWYATVLADRGFQVVGMDQVNGVVDPRIEVREGLIQVPLPFAEAAFDTVLMFDILEHLDDEAGILNEIARVCAPGGRVLVSVPHSDDGFLPQYGLTYLHRIDRTHLREYTPQTLRERLENVGFHTVYCRLEGGAHLPLVFSEFVRGPRGFKGLVRYAITALQKVGLICNPSVAGDIHWVGGKPTLS